MLQLVSHMKAMDQAYGKLGAINWIVGGDFNTAPDDPRFKGEKTIPTSHCRRFPLGLGGIPFASRITLPGTSVILPPVSTTSSIAAPP